MSGSCVHPKIAFFQSTNGSIKRMDWGNLAPHSLEVPGLSPSVLLVSHRIHLKHVCSLCVTCSVTHRSRNIPLEKVKNALNNHIRLRHAIECVLSILSACVYMGVCVRGRMCVCMCVCVCVCIQATVKGWLCARRASSLWSCREREPGIQDATTVHRYKLVERNSDGRERQTERNV